MENNRKNCERAELHLHTAMSEMDGINTVSEYIDEAIKRGMKALAVTDHFSVQSFCDAYKTVKRYSEYNYDFKLIYGAEINVLTDDDKICHATVLVKEKEGIKNLYRIISACHTEYYDKEPLIPKSKLELYREGLLIGSGCEMGELYCGVRDGKSEEELEKIASFYDYIEVVPISNFVHFIKNGFADIRDDLIKINEKVIEIGEKADKPVVCVGDVHCLHKKDLLTREVLMHHSGAADYNSLPPLYFKTTDEMLSEFDYLGEEKAYKLTVENTNALSDMICDTFAPIDEDVSYAKNNEILNIAFDKLYEKYGKNPPAEFVERLTEETSDAMLSDEMNSYNLQLSAAIAEKARQDGQHFGNRGSVASSFLAYILGITDINPMEAHYYCPKCKYVEIHPEYFCGADMEDKTCACGEKLKKDGFTIPFETFMGKDCDRKIDIDFNFAPEYQFSVMDSLKKISGGETVRAGVVSTISYKVATNMVKNFEKAENISLPEEIAEDVAVKLSRIKRAHGMHPGGMFIVMQGKKTENFTPVQYSSFDIKREIPITHFDYWNFYTLLKLDILAHNMYSMTMELEKMTKVKRSDIPISDDVTDELLKSGKTTGLPEFSSYFIREKVMPLAYDGTFDSLVRISGLSHGTDVFTDNGEELLKNGKKINEIVSCRDDVFLYLLKKGLERGFAFEISERIRKGKGLTAKHEILLSQEGVERWRLNSWNKIKYSFPRAHCVAYVKTAYQLAYYKAHFPLEFYCAFFNAYSDYADTDMFCMDSAELAECIAELEKNREPWDYSYKCEVMKCLLEMSDMGCELEKGKCHNEKNLRFIIKDGKLTTE